MSAPWRRLNDIDDTYVVGRRDLFQHRPLRPPFMALPRGFDLRARWIEPNESRFSVRLDRLCETGNLIIEGCHMRGIRVAGNRQSTGAQRG